MHPYQIQYRLAGSKRIQTETVQAPSARDAERELHLRLLTGGYDSAFFIINTKQVRGNERERQRTRCKCA